MQYGIRQRSRKRVPKRYAALCCHGNFARGLAEIYGQGSYATGYRTI